MSYKYTPAQLDYIDDEMGLSAALMTEAQHREFQALWAAMKPAKAKTPVDPALKAHRATAKKFGGKALTGTAKQKSWAESLRAEVLSSVSEAEALALCKYHIFSSAKFWIESRSIAAAKIGAVGLMTGFAIDTANAIAAEYKKFGKAACYDAVARSLADAVNAAAEGFFTQILAIDIKSATAYLQELQQPTPPAPPAPTPTPPAQPAAPAPAQPAAPAPAPKFRSGLMPRGHAEQAAKVPPELATEIAAAKKLYNFSAGKKQSAAHFAAATAVNEKLKNLGLWLLMLFVGDAPTAPTELVPVPVAPAQPATPAVTPAPIADADLTECPAPAAPFSADGYEYEAIKFAEAGSISWSMSRNGRYIATRVIPAQLSPACVAASFAHYRDFFERSTWVAVAEESVMTKQEFFASIEPTAEEVASVAAPAGRPPRRGAAGKDPRQTPAFLARAYRLWMQHSDPEQLARDDYAAVLVKSGGKYWTSDDGNHKRVYLENGKEFYNIKTGETKKI